MKDASRPWVPSARSGKPVRHLLDGLTPIRVLPKRIDAACYNRVRVALLRHAGPLRVALPGHRGLEMVLADEAWLCLDTFKGDQPILAWHEFEVAHRSSLHEPIDCRLSLYHMHAGLIMGSAAEALASGDWHILDAERPSP